MGILTQKATSDAATARYELHTRIPYDLLSEHFSRGGTQRETNVYMRVDLLLLRSIPPRALLEQIEQLTLARDDGRQLE